MKCRLLQLRILVLPFVCAAIFVLMNAPACSKRSSTTGGGPNTNFDRFDGIANDLENATSVVIYEGLPNPFGPPSRSGPSQFETESNRSDLIKLKDELFYDQKIQPSAADFRTIRDLFSSDASFSEWAGPKACGGFHSDWCFEWHTPDGVQQALICFNCVEVKFVGLHDLYCDINREPAKQLKRLLEPYRTNRPKGGSYEIILSD